MILRENEQNHDSSACKYTNAHFRARENDYKNYKKLNHEREGESETEGSSVRAQLLWRWIPRVSTLHTVKYIDGQII